MIWLALLAPGDPVTFIDATGARYHRVVRDIDRTTIVIADGLAADAPRLAFDRKGVGADGRLEEAGADHPSVIARLAARRAREAAAEQIRQRRAGVKAVEKARLRARVDALVGAR